MMEKKVDDKGKKYFNKEEFSTETQIKSYLGRLTQSQKATTQE